MHTSYELFAYFPGAMVTLAGLLWTAYAFQARSRFGAVGVVLLILGINLVVAALG